MRYGYLVAMGLILMAIGGILLGVSGVKVKTMTQSYYIYIPRYETEPPGSYFMNTTDMVSEYTGKVVLSNKPSTASLDLPPSLRPGCNDGSRIFEMKAEGSIKADKPGHLVVTVTARLKDNRSITIAVYNVNIEPLPKQAPATGMITMPLIANHTETIGYISGQPGGEEAWIVIPLLKREIPVETKGLIVSFTSNLTGELQVKLDGGDLCENMYRVNSPFLVPAGYEVQRITTPTAVQADTSMLRTGMALVVFGNIIAIIGIYGEISRKRGEDSRESLESS